MKILYIVPYVPNLIRVRPHNLIRGLARRGHQVTLATLWGDEAERASLAQIEPYVHAVVSLEIPRWRSVWSRSAGETKSRRDRRLESETRFISTRLRIAMSMR